MVTVFVIGGVAGLLRGWLAEDRTTVDCDVMQLHPEEEWERLRTAAEAIAPRLGLEQNWLNRDSKVFAWQMPLSWQGRCEHFADFGPLRVMALSRRDLIAAKVMAAAKRMQDREDLQALKPSVDDLDFVAQHLQRVERETEPGHCEPQQKIVERLRRQLEG